MDRRYPAACHWEAEMMPKEGLHHDYGRLAEFLRGLSLRLQLLTLLESLLLLISGSLLVLLGSYFALELKETFPHLPFFYSLAALIAVALLLLLGLRRVLSKPSVEGVARRLEQKFPELSDDVTNSLLLFHQMKNDSRSDLLSASLIRAQIKKTASKVLSVQTGQVVSFKRVLNQLRLLLPLAIAFSLVLVLDPQFLNRSLAFILNPFSTIPAKEMVITLEPADSVILRGSPVTIKAKPTGNRPDRLVLKVWPENREEFSLPMESEGNGDFTFRMASAQFSFRYQASAGGFSSQVNRIQVVDPPEIGRIKLTLIPPDYTSLPKEVKEEGHIEALKGTLVKLESQATKQVKEGKIVLAQGNQLPLDVKGSLLSGSLLVFYPGSYSIKVKDELGFENPDPVQYQIRLIADKYPESEIITPGQDLEVAGNEVIPLVYWAKDDFGITGVRLAIELAGREQLIDLKNASNGRFVGPELFKWDLGSLTLTAGDKVLYRIEVKDNDTVSGPKVAHSRAYTLSVKDERARVKQVGEEAQQIADALLDLLADHLESAKDRESLAKGMEEILKKLDRDLSRMPNQEERFDLESLKRNLTSLKERTFREEKETLTQEMERLSLLADDIAKKARMKEVEALAKELRNRQRRLLDSLKDLKESFNKEGLEAIMKELKKLVDLLRSVMEAMSKMATRLPDEFMNNPDLSGLDFQDFFKDLEEIQKNLASGDISAALEAAQKLLQSLSEMMAALARAGTQAGMAPFDRMQGEMSRQIGELERILAEQRNILAETDRINQEIRQRLDEAKERRIKQSADKLKEKLKELSEFLHREQKELLDEMEMLFEKGQLEGFSRLVNELEKGLSGKPELHGLTEDLKKMIKGLTPDPREALTPGHKQRFPGLSSRQENLKERTRAIQEKLEMLAQLFPGMDTEILSDFREATGAMGEASEKLREEKASDAIPPEQEAIRRLSKSQQAMQQMAQQMAMRMQAGRWGYPWGYDPRAGWYYGPWLPMPTLPQPELNRPIERGFTGIDREEFEPPSKDAYKAPKLLREKVLESLKEGVPPQYRREVERYFRGLTE
jgi:hypothetical protein